MGVCRYQESHQDNLTHHIIRAKGAGTILYIGVCRYPDMHMIVLIVVISTHRPPCESMNPDIVSQ